MLVLSRHKNEVIVINGGTPDEITIVVVEIRGDKVRLGIEADRSIPVHRKEVWEAIQRDGVDRKAPTEKPEDWEADEPGGPFELPPMENEE